MTRAIWTLAAVLALGACSKPDNADEASNSAAADSAMSQAGHDFQQGADRIGDAASQAASGAEAGGKELLHKGKDAAADAASQISTGASQAASRLKQ